MGKISVIVPVYGAEKYINRTIQSILGQSYTNIEIILIDDQSPDDCGNICDNYAEKDKRIIAVHQQNTGVSGARNAGLDIATGRYICFLDNDDFMHENQLQFLYDMCINNNVKMAMCGFCEVDHLSKLQNHPCKTCLPKLLTPTHT